MTRVGKPLSSETVMKGLCEDSTVAPSCGNAVLEVQEQLRKDLLVMFDVDLVAVFRFSLFL